MRDVSTAPGRFLCKTGGVITAQLNALAREYGITPAEGRTLEFIAAQPRPIYQKDIEEEYGLRPASASELLQNMEDQGLITREIDPSDRRRKVICIVDERKEDALQMVEKIALMEDRLIAGVDPEKLAVFEEVLEQILRNAKELNRY